MNVKNFIGNLACIFTVTFMVGCSVFNDDSDPYGVGEATKDISGVWKLLSVSRNDIDITNEMDFTQFTLNINPDGTYHIDNYLPFVVEKDGSWSVDNARYPFHLSFMENGATDSTTIDINYPITDGRRSMIVSLSPGCGNNTYTYTLQRESNSITNNK